jgi:hypothetical protein
MSTSVAPPARTGARAARGAHAEWRRFALTSIIAVATASLLLLLNDAEASPSWMHWLVSLIGVVAALGVVAVAQVTWERALGAAESEGLVEPGSPRSDD